MAKRNPLPKIIDIKYDRVGHIIMLDYDDWVLLTEWLRDHGVNVKEKSEKKHIARIDKRRNDERTR